MADLNINTTLNTIEAGTGAIEIVPGGTDTVTINNGLIIPDGTVGAPAIRLADDTNTGIYSPANEEIALTGSGADVLHTVGVASGVNNLKVTSAITGNPVLIESEGTDTDVDITVTPKGTGNVNLGTLPFDADGTVGAGQDDYVLTYDNAAGTIGLEAAAGGGALDGLTDVTAVEPSAPVSARYWRIAITENGGDANYTGVDELYFKTTAGGATVTTGGTDIASSEHVSLPASNAFDGDTGVQWITLSGSALPCYIGYDFGVGNSEAIVEYTIDPYSDARAPYAWTFESSDTGAWAGEETVHDTVTTVPDWSGQEDRTYTAQLESNNGKSLIFNSTSGDWEPSKPAIGLMSDVIVTGAAKGDILVHDGTTWVDGPAIGANDTVLTADSSISTGVKWQAAAATVLWADVVNTVTSPNASTGDKNIAIGDSAVCSTGTYSLAVGYQADATGSTAYAYGWLATATGQGAIAIGGRPEATQIHCIAIGQDADAGTGGGSYSTAIGSTSQAKEQGDLAVGDRAAATSTHSAGRNLCIGSYANASGTTANHSIAIGTGTSTGNSASTTAYESIAIGTNSDATASGAVCLGANQATGTNSLAVGDASNATANQAVSVGKGISNSVADSARFGSGANYLDINATGGMTLGGTSKQFVAPTYTVATLPTGIEGGVIYVSDGDTGSKCLAMYDGTNWLRVVAGAAVAAS